MFISINDQPVLVVKALIRLMTVENADIKKAKAVIRKFLRNQQRSLTIDIPLGVIINHQEAGP